MEAKLYFSILSLVYVLYIYHQFPHKLSFYLFESVLIRSAAGASGFYTTEISNILRQEVFLDALYLANPELYTELQKKGFEEYRLTSKEVTSIRKYFNRYCFRPVPFGAFAGVTLSDWSGTIYQLPPLGEKQLHLFPSYPFLLKLKDKLRKSSCICNLLLHPNPTLYYNDGFFRFVRTDINEFSQREYQLQSIRSDQLLKKLFKYAVNGVAGKALSQQIVQLAGCNIDDAFSYIKFLIDSQLLIDDLFPGLTEKNYLSNVIAKKLGDSADISIKLADTRLSKAANSQNLVDIRKAASALNELVEHPDRPLGHPLNIILEGTPQKIMLDLKHRAGLRDAIIAAAKLSPKRLPVEFEQFRKNFASRFEGRSLALMQALDPETGIGYLQSSYSSPLAIPLNSQQPVHHPPDWSTVQELLLNKWHRLDRLNSLQEIKLTKSDLEDLPFTPNDIAATGANAIFRVMGDHTFVEIAGGVNAGALLGRFAVINEAFGNLAKEVAMLTQGVNPNVIFAELLHLSDPHVDNINMREHGWNFELPILHKSQKNNAEQIQLQDLQLALIDGKLWLWSLKHRKIVIPRLSSAYNFRLNQLPVFRFLCDLAFQYNQSDLSLDLEHYFPGLKSYPRVSYHGHILALAKWILDPAQVDRLLSAEHDQRIIYFRIISEELGIPDVFCFSEGDRQLQFDRRVSSQVELFLQSLKKNTPSKLTERPLTMSEEQYHAFLIPSKPLHVPIRWPKRFKATAPIRNFVPGSDWLYFKLYSSTAVADTLLLKSFAFIEKLQRNGSIIQWFFIRYADPAPHIRLRIRVTSDKIGYIVSGMQRLMASSVNKHLVREYQLDVYRRELERYISGGIPETEEHFWKSSLITINYIRWAKSHEEEAHIFALRLIWDLLVIFYPNPNDRKFFCANRYRSFQVEFSSPRNKYLLDSLYRSMQKDMERRLSQSNFYKSRRLERHFKALITGLQTIAPKITAAQDREHYVSSLLHMQINRILKDDARRQEMSIYYLLYKYQDGLIARNRVA